MNVVNKCFFNKLANAIVMCGLVIIPTMQSNALQLNAKSSSNEPPLWTNNLICNTDNKLDNVLLKSKCTKKEIADNTYAEESEIPQGLSNPSSQSHNVCSTSLFSTLTNYLMMGCIIGTGIVFAKNMINRATQTEKGYNNYSSEIMQKFIFTFRGNKPKGIKNFHRSQVYTFSKKLSELVEKLNEREVSFRVWLKNSILTRKLASIIEERRIDQLQQSRKQLQTEQSMEIILEHDIDELEKEKQKLVELISTENNVRKSDMLACNLKKVSEDLRNTEKELANKQRSIENLKKSISHTLAVLHKNS